VKLAQHFGRGGSEGEHNKLSKPALSIPHTPRVLWQLDDTNTQKD